MNSTFIACEAVWMMATKLGRLFGVEGIKLRIPMSVLKYRRARMKWI